jgi:hypothetical protein
LYDTHSKVLTVAPLQDAGDLGSKADFLGAMLAMIDGIKAQHPDAVLTRQRQTIDGKPSIVYILSEQKREGSDPAAEIRVDVATNRISSIWMRVQMLGPDGRVVTAKSVTDLDYPPSGPADIYGMGVPRDARVQDLTPPNAVKDLDGKVSAAMEAFAPSYYAIIAKIRSVPESDRSEAMQEFWAVYKKNGKYRVQTYSIDPHQYGKLPADDFKALESMAARHRISSLLFIPDRKSEVYVSLDRSGRLSRQRTAGMTLDKVVEGFAWSYGWNRQPLDQRYGQVAALVPATNPSRSTLITRQETWQGVRVNPGRWNNPTRLRESFDPRHDYIRQTYEWLGSYQAEWQRDPRMLQELQSEPDVLRYRQAHAWTVLEYARTPQGQWYPKMLREEFEAAGKHAPGDRVIDLPRQATIYHIHLDSARDISDSLLDPDQVSPALFGTPTPAERQSR